MQAVEHLGRQATGLGAEQQRVARSVGHVAVQPPAAGAEGPQARRGKTLQASRQIRVALHRGVLVVVEPGAAQARVVRLEAERFDQVQRGAGVGAQPYDVAGVGRDLR
jgi:hypothetical protein